MIDWDHDGDIDSEDIGLSAMLLDDVSSEEQERPKRKKGCLSGCFGIAALALSILAAVIAIPVILIGSL
jgi:hypothetical protein